MGEKQYLGGVASLSSSSHGGTGLDSFHRYARPFVKTCESGVYNGGGACGLPYAGGPCVPRTHGRVHGVLHGVL
jgi:hypothetical protein